MIKDILTINKNELNIEIQASKIASVREKNLLKKSARVFQNGRISLASFIGNISDEELFAKCKKLTSVGIPYDYEIPSNLYFSKKLSDKKEIELDEAYEVTKKSLKHLQELNDNFIYSGAVKYEIFNLNYRNTNEVDLERGFEKKIFEILFKHKKSANIIDGWFAIQTMLEADFKDMINKNIDFLNTYENEVNIDNGIKQVMFLDYSQLLRKLSESLRIDRYKDNSALYSGKCGEKLFSEKFSLYDVNNAPKSAVFRPFDEEGVLRKEAYLPLIENGVFKNYICDLRNAKKYDTCSTANGQRNFNSNIGLAFNALLLGKGARKVDDIIKDIDEGVIVVMSSGGDFLDNGDYSTPVQLSYLVKNGKIIGRLPQLTLKTSIDKMFGSDFIEVSSDGYYQESDDACAVINMEIIKA